jgi:hypothetical protein
MFYPSKEEWRKRFICTLLSWADREESLEVSDFPLEMKMHRSLLYEWVAKYPDIKEAWDIVKLKIASKRRKGALTRKYDKDVVFRDMHKYDPEWLEINKYHADLKKEEDRQPTTFVILDNKPRVLTKQEMKEIAENVD